MAGRLLTRRRRQTPLTAEDVRAQEFIAEFTLGVVLLAQLNKVGQLFIRRFQLLRRHCKQLSPMRAGLKWSQFNHKSSAAIVRISEINKCGLTWSRNRSTARIASTYIIAEFRPTFRSLCRAI
jgi:hypothetical protein